MNITLHKIPIREVYDGYTESEECGVWSYGGKLNIHPRGAREDIQHPITASSCAGHAKKRQFVSVIGILLRWIYGGGTQIRTGGKGFAVLCLTTWLYRLATGNNFSDLSRFRQVLFCTVFSAFR